MGGQTAVDQKTEFLNSKVQAEHEIQLLKQVPEMKTQLKSMELQKQHLERILAAVEAGFDPYTPPSNWYHGFLHRPKFTRVDRQDKTYRLYTRALPREAIEKLPLARKHFDIFTIHSPDSEVFLDIRPRIITSDPVLVGWIGAAVAEYGGLINKDSSVIREGFLIAAWDIAKDLGAADLLLEAPKGASISGEDKG